MGNVSKVWLQSPIEEVVWLIQKILKSSAKNIGKNWNTKWNLNFLACGYQMEIILMNGFCPFGLDLLKNVPDPRITLSVMNWKIQ